LTLFILPETSKDIEKGGLDFWFWTIEKGKKNDKRQGETKRRGQRSSNFILKVRILV
jgi:hypothetical protein